MERKLIVSEGTEVTGMAGALAAATAEMEQASSIETEPVLPTEEVEAVDDGEQAPEAAQGQPAAEEDGYSDEVRELAELLVDPAQESQNSSDSGTPVPGSDDFWNQSVEVKTVNGRQTVTLQELSDGYLRQADYTQKTQSLASERKRLERADEFLAAFEGDPQGFIRSLAVRSGLIGEGDVPVNEIEMVPIPTQESLDQMVTDQVEERYKNDPRVQEMTRIAAEQQISSEFQRIEEIYGVPITDEARQSVLKEAYETGNANLEGIVAGRLVLAQQKQSKAGATNRAATSRPGSAPAGASEETPQKVKSMRDAWQQAKVDAAQQ